MLVDMVGFQQLELSHSSIQLYFLHDQRIAGSKRLYFCEFQGGIVHIFAGTGGRLAGHHLRNETLFVLQNLPHISIKCAFRQIAEDANGIINVALTQNTTFLLFHIGRPPGYIQVVHGIQSILNIGSCTHLERRTEDDTNLSVAHLGEQCFFLGICRCLMDKGNLFPWDSLGDQLFANIIVDIERTVALWCR